MIKTKGFAANTAKAPLAPFEFERRDVGSNDVQFDILFCGVCHSDLHQVRDEWGGGKFPMVPGHEIVGKVTKVGEKVTKFKVGDLAGVGCMVDSCRKCKNCNKGLEQFCTNGASFTYNSFEIGTANLTYGGYSNNMVVREEFALKISNKLSLSGVAPLLCAGITTYSPLKHWKVGKGHKVAVLGLGGLGHMAVKFAVAFGAEVTMLSTSASKEMDAKKLGAHKFILTSNPDSLNGVKNYFDFIIDTVSAPHDYNLYLSLLDTDGVHICVGVPPTPTEILGFNLIGNRRSIAGSLIGGLPETQEMLDYCAEHNIVSDIELIDIKNIEKAFERMLKGDVRYRFVIDMATL
ncbi:MAG: NAD(P)-dependent alcohol dehydrogenase [Opitutaceae bacterium]|nr:NAD(P)-dependent alcohol dehydrogenase [Cytophagales bacterium]